MFDDSLRATTAVYLEITNLSCESNGLNLPDRAVPTRILKSGKTFRTQVGAMRTAEVSSLAGIDKLPTNIRWAPKAANRDGRVRQIGTETELRHKIYMLTRSRDGMLGCERI